MVLIKVPGALAPSTRMPIDKIYKVSITLQANFKPTDSSQQSTQNPVKQNVTIKQSGRLAPERLMQERGWRRAAF
ncbi:hypothetical protein A3K71_00520 [archaeon RBG_16_50_20]|nr:MAG: hypothetical protein A3K71_00520 [archaeon RBG_16_50_20]